MGGATGSGQAGACITKGLNMRREDFSYDKLHPKVRKDFQLLALKLEDGFKAGLIPVWFKPFEGYRSPERQLYLLNVTKTTKAGPWQSAHNYGCAVDFVPWDPTKGGWYWPDADHAAWSMLRAQANNRGLWNELAWDRPHVEHAIWRAVRGQLV